VISTAIFADIKDLAERQIDNRMRVLERARGRSRAEIEAEDVEAEEQRAAIA
jgi:hypothetical protein